MMYRLLVVTWYLLLVSHCLVEAVEAVDTQGYGVVRKCCPVDQSLGYDEHSNLICTPTTTDETDWSWLPDHHLLDEHRLNQTLILHEFPKCDAASKDIVLLNRNASADDYEKEFTLSVDSNNFVLSVHKDSARHHLHIAHPTQFSASTFCVDVGPGDYHIAVLCPCGEATCVRKCCRDTRAINASKVIAGDARACEDVADGAIKYWLPLLEKTEDPEHVYYRLVASKPSCPNAYNIYPSPGGKNVSRNLQLLSNYSLKSLKDNRIFPVNDYCADYTVDYGEVIFFCTRDDVALNNWSVVYGCLFLVGIIGLSLTVFLTLWLPELRQTLHQRMVLAHNVMLLVSNTTACVLQWNQQGFSKGSCIVMGFVIQISLLSTFFWLNSMCLEITWVFSGLQRNQATAHSVARRFLWFALYSWGSTSVVTCVMAVFEFSPSITVLKPMFGVKQCSFNNPAARWLFLYGPIALLLLVNCILFAFTSFKILKVKRQTAILNEQDSSNNCKNKHNFLIFTKLFCLMGVSWVTEILQLLIGGSVWAWLITDIVNLLQGVFIFIIFCCNRSVYNLVRAKLRPLATRVGVRLGAEPTASTTGSSLTEMESKIARTDR